jgi:glycolate oxidase
MKTDALLTKEQMIHDLYTCASCGYCKFACPVNKELGFESTSVRGKLLILRKLLEGKLDYSDARVRDAVFQCAQCEACKVMCPTGIDFVKINQHLRESLAKEGNLLEMQKTVGKILAEKKNPFNEPPEERGAWLGSAYKNPEKADYLYFVSCTASYSANRIAKSVQRIMKAAGIEFAVLGGEEQCCGNPLLRMGEREKFEEMVAANMAAFDKMGIKTIFTACAGCYKAFLHDYPKKYEVLHVVQLMDRLIREGRLKFKPLPKRVMYFDGCDIGRHCGIYEEPRNVLRAIPQLELIEFDYNREEALCCGGPLIASYPELAGQIPTKHVQEAIDKNADILVSACAACMLNFKEGAKRLGSKLDIQDICMLTGKQV